MNSPAKSTRERILDRGLDRLSRSGLAGVTLGVLAEDVGMSKSGLFAHFRSKEAVQIALLRRMATVADAVVVAPAMRATAGIARLTALVGLWLGWTTRAGLAGGCPVAAAMFELDDLDGEVRAEVVAMESHWRALLAELTREAVARDQLRGDLDIDQFVWELCGVYLSHHVSGRFLRDPRGDERASAAFHALLARSGAAALTNPATDQSPEGNS